MLLRNFILNRLAGLVPKRLENGASAPARTVTDRTPNFANLEDRILFSAGPAGELILSETE